MFVNTWLNGGAQCDKGSSSSEFARVELESCCADVGIPAIPIIIASFDIPLCELGSEFVQTSNAHQLACILALISARAFSEEVGIVRAYLYFCADGVSAVPPFFSCSTTGSVP